MATLRVNVDPAGAVKGAGAAESAIEGVARSAHRMEASTTNASKSLGNMGNGMGGAANKARGLAMQLSQVTDMGLATGQWSRALFIQASDIAMLFGGPLAIALGMAVGVLGTLGTSFLKAGDGANSFEDTIDALTQSVRDYRDAARDMGAGLDDLTARFGGNVEAGRRVLEIQQQLIKVRAQAAVSGGLSAVGAEIGGGPFSALDPRLITASADALENYRERIMSLLEAEVEAGAQEAENNAAREVAIQLYADQLYQVDRLDSSLANLADTLGVEVGPAVAEVARAMAELSQAEGINEQVQASEKLAQAIYDATDGFSNGNSEAHALYQTLLDAVTAGLEFESINFSASITSAADEAARLETKLRDAYGLYAFTRERAPDEPVDHSTKTRRGRRSAVLDLGDEYDKLRSSLDPVFRATQQFEASQTLLNNALAQGQITQAQYNETLAMARAEYDEVIAAQQEFQFNFSGIQSSMENAFQALGDGTKSAKDAFRSMAKSILAELYRVLVVQQLVGQFNQSAGGGSGLMGMIAPLFGMRAEGGNVQAGEAYLVGERGPEIFRPAASGQIDKGAQGGVVINQTFTFQANGDASVKQIIRQSMPEIAEMSKAAVLDARQRGGAFGGAFR